MKNFFISCLRGAGQVFFQNSAWSGILLIAGIFWGSHQAGSTAPAWGALLALAVSTLTGRILHLPEDDGRQGLWGFNGILVGCAFPTFLDNSVWMWLALILCAALSTWVRTGLNNVMRTWRINSLTFPFVLTVWLFLLAAHSMHSLPSDSLPVPGEPAAFASAFDAGFMPLLRAWLCGISQVFLIDSPITGLIFIVALAVSSPRAAIWGAVGSAAALCMAILLRASASDITHGLYGFSPVLTAIALGAVFHRPSFGAAIWALLGCITTVFVQAAFDTALAPVGIPSLTAPFCIVTWLFLLPLVRFASDKAPDHSDWHRHGSRQGRHDRKER